MGSYLRTYYIAAREQFPELFLSDTAFDELLSLGGDEEVILDYDFDTVNPHIS